MPDNDTAPSTQNIGIFTTDSHLAIRSWDDWLARVTGLPAESVYGKLLVELFPDLAQRGLLERFERVLAGGVVEVLAPAFHHYLIPCPPQTPSRHFDTMQQYATIAPLRDEDRIVGVIVTIEDVTPRLERQRELAAQLNSPDEAERLHAAQLLAGQKVAGATQTLAAALGDESWQVRRAAVGGLARHGGAEAAASLLLALRQEHQNLSVLNSALQVLSMINVDVLPPLLEFLQTGDADLRIYAALALGEQGNPQAIPALLNALNDPDLNVRYHAIEALGKLQATEAVDKLVNIARSPEFFLAFPALDALAQIGDPQAAPQVVSLLEDDLLRAPVVNLLGRLGDEAAVPPLVGLLNSGRAPAAVVAQALAGLYYRYQSRYREGGHIADLTRRAINQTGIDHLANALNQSHTTPEDLQHLALVLGWLKSPTAEKALTRLVGNPAVRSEVVTALVRHGRQVTGLLIDQLRTGDPETRQAAVVALGRIGDAQAVPALLDVLANNPDLTLLAAAALAKIGDRRAFDPLLQLIGHPNAAARQSIIAALNSLGHPDMAAAVKTRLSHPNPLVRESAVKIAGYFGYPECLDLVLERCRDGSQAVRLAAIEHLPYFDDERIVPALADALLDGASQIRAAVARALGQLEGKAALPYLLLALKDTDPWVRYFAAASSGKQGFTETVEPLARLAQKDPAMQVRVAAVQALGCIGGARVVAILSPLAKDANPDLARTALEALAAIGHPNALLPLEAALKSSAPARRVEIVHTLARRKDRQTVNILHRLATEDENEPVVQAAINILAQHGTSDAAAALVSLLGNPARREACIAALAQMGQAQIKPVAAALAHHHPDIRIAAVEILARMKHPRASEHLIAALDDEAPPVRLAAVSALVDLGTLQARQKLARLAREDRDPAVCKAARQALNRQTTQEA